MSLVGFGMDALLGLLLVAALAVGLRLNGKLTALRLGQAGFVKAVADLDAAAMRAETGLDALRAATLDAHDHLLGRIETARALADRLEHIVADAETASLRVARATADDRVRSQTVASQRPGAAPVRTPHGPGAPDLQGPGAALARFVARRDREWAGRSA